MSMTYLDPASWSTSDSPNLFGVVVGGLDYNIQNANKTYSFTSPSTGVLRFEVRSGDTWAAIDPTTKNRSEISGVTTYAIGTIINVDYYMTIEAGVANTAPWLVMGQFHHVDNLNYSPPFEINFNGNERMGVSVNYINSSGAQAYKQLWTDSANIVRDHEYHMQIHAKFDADTNSGTLVVIRDGVTIVNYAGPMGFPGMTRVYWKQGIYRAASSTTLAARYRALSVTTGSFTASPPTFTSLSTQTATAWATQTLSVAADAGLLSTATDHNSLSMTAALHTQATHGTAHVNSDGSFTYTPNAGYTGSDSFTYVVSDTLSSSAPGTVTINVA